MRKGAHPTELAETLLERSVCAVQVAAVLADRWGTFAWGWNSSGGTGLGEHAEAHALRRANRSRLESATMFVAAKRKRNGRAVTALPCPFCQRVARCVGQIIYRDSEEVWRLLQKRF